jgi:hypothetical protein
MAEWLCSLARTNVAVADLGGVRSSPSSYNKVSEKS